MLMIEVCPAIRRDRAPFWDMTDTEILEMCSEFFDLALKMSVKGLVFDHLIVRLF